MAPDPVILARPFLLFAAGVIAVVSIPLILKIMPRSSRYGFRTPLTLSSDDLWIRGNCFAGRASLCAAAVSAGLLLVVSPSANPGVGFEIAMFTLPIMVAVVASFAYVRHISLNGGKGQ